MFKSRCDTSGMTQWFRAIVEASDEETYYKCFTASTPRDPDPDTSYEKWYGPLEEKIWTVLASRRVPRKAVNFFDDWSPNRTRHFTIERRYLSPRLVRSLHAILRGDYTRWRIEIIVVGVLSIDDHVGHVALWKDWVLCWGCGRELIPSTSSGTG